MSDVIDWTRMAQPQDDHYDTAIALQALQTNRLQSFCVFQPCDRAPFNTVGDGHVRAQYAHPHSPYGHVVNAPLDASAIPQAVEYLRVWPAMFHQFQALIRCVHPLALPLGADCPELFSSSGSHESEFGVIYATVHHPLALAEALVHETAHHKLFALGIGIEQATRLILNPSHEHYMSPVIKYQLRPMSAVFHAAYTFTHIVHLDLLLLAAARHDAEKRALVHLLDDSVSTIRHGVEVVNNHIKLDTHGRQFVDGFLAWAEALIEVGQKILNQVTDEEGSLP